mgnify:CR=1 FL=1
MITEILLLTPVYVTLFWIIVLNMHPKKGNEPKRFLGKFMMAAFLVYIAHLFFFLNLNRFYIWIDCFYSLASLAVFPLYFIYVRLLTRDDRFRWKLHGRYLIAPLIIFVLTAIGYIIMDNATEFKYVTFVQHGIPATGTGINYMKTIAVVTKVVFVSQVIFYVILATRIINRHNLNLNNYYSEHESRKLRWVQIYNLFFLLAALASTVVALIGRVKFEGSDLYLLFPSVVFSMLLFTIGLLGNSQKAVHTEIHIPSLTVAIDDKIPERLKDDLLDLFEKKRFYLNKDLKIWDITGQLGTNRTYVSRIINQEFGQNFCGFVNSYRVEYAKKLLGSKKVHSIEEIADLSGFGSVNSLYRAFLAREKIPLKEYRTSLKNNSSGD